MLFLNLISEPLSASQHPDVSSAGFLILAVMLLPALIDVLILSELLGQLLEDH